MTEEIQKLIEKLEKKIKCLSCEIKDLEVNGIPGPPGGFGAYGSWYSTVDQINTLNNPLAVTVTNTDFTSGVSMVGGSQITFAAAGKYNIQFSLQLHHRAGGGSGKMVDIWLAKNGTAIPNSNTKVSMDTNTPYKVAAWNFFVDAAAGDFYQLMWATDNVSIVIEQEAVGTIHPETPSVIITVNQIG